MHTPGPWEADIPKPAHKGHYAAGTCARISPAGSISTVADVPVFTDNWKANARLIAAAPELLTALKNTIQILEAVRFSAGLGKNQLERIAKARAALAKATGEQP